MEQVKSGGTLGLISGPCRAMVGARWIHGRGHDRQMPHDERAQPLLGWAV